MNISKKTVACYAAVMVLLAFDYSLTLGQTPIEPADSSVNFNIFYSNLSSPRDTLKAFLATTDQIYDLIHDDGFNPENWAEIQQITARQMRLFDLWKMRIAVIY